MNWFKRIAAIGTAAALCVGITGCTQQEQELQTIRVCEVTHSVFYAPQYVAISEGFFEQEGLNIELSNGGGADKVMAAVLSNNMDIGFAGPEACIYVYNEGKEDFPKVFAQMTKRDGSFLVARENQEPFSWDSLRGKVVIPGRKGGVPYMTFEHVLKQNGLQPGVDVTLDDSIQFDLMAGAFSSGKADYVTLFEPTASAVIQSGKGYYACSVGAESGEIPYTSYFAKQSYMKDHNDVIEKFTRAIAKGQEWVQQHSAKEIAASIASQFPDNDQETLATAIQSYQDIDAWNATPVMSEEAFSRLQDVIIEAGELSNKLPLDTIVDNSYAKSVSE